MKNSDDPSRFGIPALAKLPYTGDETSDNKDPSDTSRPYWGIGECDLISWFDKKTCLAGTRRITGPCPVLSGGQCFLDT